MSIRVINDLPSSAELDERFPIGPEHRIEEHRQTARAILAGVDPRLLLVAGPCSSWPSKGVYDFADRATALQERVRDRIFIVDRMYVQKPRTTEGWPGPLTQPDPGAPHDIRRGILLCREMMWRIGKQLPLADEMLYTQNVDGFASPLTYIAVGARSSEDTEHRHVASGLESVVGIKNPTSGNIVKGVDGVQVAQHPQHLLLSGKHVETTGNPYAHLVLRGGETAANYGPESLALAMRELQDKKRRIQNPAIVVDASHDNSRNGHGKDPSLQAYVVRNVLDGVRRRREEFALVRGFMIEAHILGGKQQGTPNPDIPQSITDPCVSWEEFERIVLDTADTLDRAL